MKLRTIAPILITASLLSACGGGSDGDATTETPASSTTSLSGLASKGPLKNAMVTAYAIAADGTVGAKLAEQATDVNGAYTLNVGAYTGAVQLVVTAAPGMTLLSKDEATGKDQPLPADFTLRANTTVTGSSLIQNASITPFTEMAHQIALDSGGLNATNLASASKVVFDLIGVDPVATKPLDATVAPPADATDAEKRYALFNAAVSAMAKAAPATTNATALACFNDAGSDAGKRIKCAVEQIAKSVTVTPGANASVVPNNNLVGLTAALVAASANDAINKTGRTITSDDSDAKLLGAVEDDVIAGTVTPIKLVVTTEESSDIAKAKSFFSRLRSNAAALSNAPLDTGLADGVKAFGDSIRTESLAVAGDTADVVQLANIAYNLWKNYTSGATASVNNPPIQGFPGGCTVYQGAFPTRFGGAPGEALQPYTTGATEATTAANAAWVGCTLNQGVQPTLVNGVTQYRRSILFDMAASTAPGTVPYIAVARKRFIDKANNNALTQQNLSPTLSGAIGYTVTGDTITSAKIVGDLPAPAKSDGTLLAARYPIDIQGAMTTLPSGATQIAFTGGSFGVVPVGATAASLTLNLSVGGESVVVVPDLNTDAAQVADAKLNIAASIETANGKLTGTLMADRFTVDSFGDLEPTHAKFTGSIAAAGNSGTVATFFSGTLEGTNGDQPVVSFNGTLTLPSRPVLTLSLSVTQTVAASADSRGSYTMTGRYAQDAVTVQLTGTRVDREDTLTLADSSGVSVSTTTGTGASVYDVVVSGRQTAKIDQDRGRIVYGDGTFESLN